MIVDKPLVLVGGGGHCRSVIEVAESAGRSVRCILDLPEYLGTESSGYPVAGTDDDMPRYAAECEFVVTLGSVGNAAPRRRLHAMVRDAGGVLATLVAPTAFVSPRAVLGAGTVVLHQCVVNVNATIGEGCIINSGAIVEHDALVGDYSHISTGARVNGACRVGSGCFVGSGAVLVHGVSVCDNAVIGAGAVVAADITEPGVYVGVPARRIK